MPRVKGSKVSHKKREKLLRYTKGFRWGRKSKERAAKEALVHAWTHAFQGRKERKRNFRALWQVKIDAGLAEAMSYSKFIGLLKKANIALNRKMLGELAEFEPKTFAAIMKRAEAAAPAAK